MKDNINYIELYEKENKKFKWDAFHLVLSYYSLHYYSYALTIIGLLLSVSYGTIWYEGVNTIELLKYLYFSPY